jgi:hypothetical protein
LYFFAFSLLYLFYILRVVSLNGTYVTVQGDPVEDGVHGDDRPSALTGRVVIYATGAASAHGISHQPMLTIQKAPDISFSLP